MRNPGKGAFSKFFEAITEKPIDALVRFLTRQGIRPNTVTLIGLLLNIVAAAFLAIGVFLVAGILMIAAGACDLLDGRVARASQRVTRFGAFLDSVIDRYSDVALLLGIAIRYLLQHDSGLLLLTLVGIIGSLMVSYTRARAETVIPSCTVGFLERPERLVLLIVGALFGIMPAVLWMLAILSHYTAAHRVYFVWQQLRAQEAANLDAAEAATTAAQSPLGQKVFRWFFYDLERGTWQYDIACVVLLFILFLQTGVL